MQLKRSLTALDLDTAQSDTQCGHIKMYPAKSGVSWITGHLVPINLEQCKITEAKQKWSCEAASSLRQPFTRNSGQADHMYITLENGLILAKSNALTGWKRLQVQRSKICYSCMFLFILCVLH